MLIVASLLTGVLQAVQGPYDQWLHNRPADYVRVAGWFSLAERFRPVLNPWLRVKGRFEFPRDCARGSFHPLIGTGKFGSRYVVRGACLGGGRIALESDHGQNVRSVETDLDPGTSHLIEAEFRPQDRVMEIRLDNRIVIRHQLEFLITAPWQLKYGVDETFAGKERFDGRIEAIAAQVAGVRLR